MGVERKLLSAGLAALLLPSAAWAADPTTADCLAASEKSITLKGEGRLREARSELLVCAAGSCPADIRNECTRRVAEVNAAIPTILFEAKDAAGNDLGRVRVSMDGKVLSEKLQGTALSIDPGEHVFRFEAEGKPPLEKTFVIAAGAKDRRESIVLGATSDVAAQGGPSGASAGGVPEERPWMSPSTQRVLGWTGVGVGVVGVTLGVVFAIKRSSKMSDLDAICPSNPCVASSRDLGSRTQQVSDLRDEVTSAGTLSAVGFIAGGLFAAGGVTLLLTAPKDAAPSTGFSPVLSPSYVGLTWRRAVW